MTNEIEELIHRYEALSPSNRKLVKDHLNLVLNVQRNSIKDMGMKTEKDAE